MYGKAVWKPEIAEIAKASGGPSCKTEISKSAWIKPWYPLKMSENQRFVTFFKDYRNEIGLNWVMNMIYTIEKFFWEWFFTLLLNNLFISF